MDFKLNGSYDAFVGEETKLKTYTNNQLVGLASEEYKIHDIENFDASINVLSFLKVFN